MDKTTLARILWATTRDWSSATNPAVTRQCRDALAAILATGGTAGFRPAAEPSPADRTGAAWQECAAAAGAALPPPATAAPACAVLVPARTATPLVLDYGGLAWPTAPGSVRDQQIGPFRIAGDARDWYLETYTAMDAGVALASDGEGGPGLYPCVPAAAGAGPAPEPEPEPEPEPVDRRAITLSFAGFIVAILLACASLVMTYGASRLTEGARVALLERAATVPPAEAAATGPAGPSAEAITAARGCRDEIGNTGATVQQRRDACVGPWADVWSTETSAALPTDATWERHLAAWVRDFVDVGRNASLIWPLMLSYATILVLVAAGGLAVKGRWYGALVDGRNRVSLSRLQMLCWTVVLLGGYLVVGIFNIALLGSPLRELAQQAVVDDAAAGLLRQFPGFFPSMAPQLWAVLGITVAVSPFLSQMILNEKPREPAGGETDSRLLQAKAPLVGGMLAEGHATIDDSRWSDLVSGEEVGNEGQVDVSRLQYLVITFVLLGGYLTLLVRYLGTLDGAQILTAAATFAPVFPSMPPVDGTFVGLLALSHGGYLAFKAMPSTGAGVM